MAKRERAISRLPKWAQAEIARLEANERSAAKVLSSMTDGRSRVSFGYGDGGAPEGFLPEAKPYFFRTGSPWDPEGADHHGQITVSLHRSQESNREDFEIHVMGTDRIEVLPNAANRIIVRLMDDGRRKRPTGPGRAL